MRAQCPIVEHAEADDEPGLLFFRERSPCICVLTAEVDYALGSCCFRGWHGGRPFKEFWSMAESIDGQDLFVKGGGYKSTDDGGATPVFSAVFPGRENEVRGLVLAVSTRFGDNVLDVVRAFYRARARKPVRAAAESLGIGSAQPRPSVNATDVIENGFVVLLHDVFERAEDKSPWKVAAFADGALTRAVDNEVMRPQGFRALKELAIFAGDDGESAVGGCCGQKKSFRSKVCGDSIGVIERAVKRFRRLLEALGPRRWEVATFTSALGVCGVGSKLRAPDIIIIETADGIIAKTYALGRNHPKMLDIDSDVEHVLLYAPRTVNVPDEVEAV